jgi:pimeloyl-ACP methyl ester carboxylesterase
MNPKISINPRKYGTPPFRTAVIHGGPGAPGYMAPVARELAKITGILEPLQTKDSLKGQIEELQNQLTEHAEGRVMLIGSSWGAVLALFLAAEYKELVAKLILVGSAVFDARSSASIEGRRLQRLTPAKRRRYQSIMQNLMRAPENQRDILMREWGEILDDTDMCDPITQDLEIIEVQYDIFSKVWFDFTELRDQPGYLKNLFSKINLPVVVIHGEYDPHPIEGIRPFLKECITNIHFYILPDCGHYPWNERRARDKFFEIVSREI